MPDLGKPTINSKFLPSSHLRSLWLIDTRAELLPLEEQLEEALDEYLMVRDAYLQRREFLIYDGRPPIEDECEFEEDCEEW